MCEQKVSTYMPSWALLVMTAVCKEVRKKTVKVLPRIKQKLKGAWHPLGVSARACNIFVTKAHMHSCGVKNLRACQTAHL